MASEPPQAEPSQADLASEADTTYRSLLEKYLSICDEGSLSITLGALGAVGFIVTNLEQLKPLVGVVNIYVTTIAISLIAASGLALQWIYQRLSAVLKIGKLSVESEDGANALRHFRKALQVGAEPRKPIVSKDIHETWKPTLSLVRLSTQIALVRNIAILTTTATFIWGVVEAANGHDKEVETVREEIRTHIEATEKKITELEAAYKETESAAQALISNQKEQIQNLRVLLDFEKSDNRNLATLLVSLIEAQRAQLEQSSDPLSQDLLRLPEALKKKFGAVSPQSAVIQSGSEPREKK